MAEFLDIKIETENVPTKEQILANPLRARTDNYGYLVISYYTPNQPPNRFAIDKTKYVGNVRMWNVKNNNYDVYIVLEGNTKLRIASVCETMSTIIVQTIEQELKK